MVTLKDVADACGLSRSTVSKALNGYDDISQSTILLVRRKAEELGYLPNVAARSLKTNQTYNIGILFSDELGSGFKHEYFTSLLDSFQKEVESAGYHITFISQVLGESKMTYLEQCRYRNFDGVLIACADYSDAQVTALVRGDFPIVTIDHVFQECTSVNSDNTGGMQAMMEQVIAKGHRKIAYIHGDMTAVTVQRLASFHRACLGSGISQRDEWVIPSRYRDADACYTITKELLAGKERPTCILYPDDFALMGGLRALRELHIRIPHDISIVGYDGSFLTELISPKITTVRQDTDTIGRTAAKKLIAAIKNPKLWIPEQIVVPSSVQEGESLAECSTI